MWDLPRPGIELLSSALQGRFLTIGPPRKPSMNILVHAFWCVNVCVSSVYPPRNESSPGAQEVCTQCCPPLSKAVMLIYTCGMGFPGKEPACQCRRHKEMWVPLLGQKDPLEEGTVTHFSILAWRIPWTEEPGGLQSLKSKKSRTRLKWFSTHTHTYFWYMRGLVSPDYELNCIFLKFIC